MEGIAPTMAAVLGKLGEESAELCNIIMRIWIQGIDGADPGTGKPNTVALWEEIADVEAMIEMCKRVISFLPRDLVAVRREKKIAMKTEWIRMLEEHYLENAPTSTGHPASREVGHGLRVPEGRSATIIDSSGGVADTQLRNPKA